MCEGMGVERVQWVEERVSSEQMETLNIDHSFKKLGYDKL